MEREIIKCGRCKRVLKSDLAKERGFGKTCFDKVHVKSKVANLLERKEIK